MAIQLNSNALCTAEEQATFSGLDATDTNIQNSLVMYINGVSNQMQKLIGRNIFASDYVEKYKGTDTTDLILKNYPINSVSSVKYIVQGGDFRDVDDSEYDIDEESGILSKETGWLLSGFSSYMSDRIDFPRNNIEVSYNAGYTDVPTDLKMVCMQIVNDNYEWDHSQGTVLSSYKISDISFEWKDGIKISNDQLNIILSYKSINC
jgi:hypothetical protein